jgi:hypothetical protein
MDDRTIELIRILKEPALIGVLFIFALLYIRRLEKE